MTAQIVNGLLLWLTGLLTGVHRGRRVAYRDAVRSLRAATMPPEERSPLPIAALPPASRRSIRRAWRRQRADLAHVLRRPHR